MVIEPNEMKRPQRESRIIMENVAETLSKDVKHGGMDSLPDMLPVSDTSASSCASSSRCSGTPQHHRATLSDTSEAESIQQLEDEKAWVEHAEQRNCNRRKVRWGDVEIRLFPMVPGDHPDAQGVPVRQDAIDAFL